MKLLSASILVFSLSVGTFGARVLERSKFSAKEKCPAAKEVAAETFIVNGNEILHQTFDCPDGSLGGSNPPAGNGKTFSSNVLEKRNAAECRTPSPECQCGTAFVCECQDVTASAPNSGDCSTLINALSVSALADGPTFIVQPDNFELVSFATCALEWTSFGTTPLEYCWDELASTGSLVNQVCFEQNQGTAGACNSNNGLWLSQVLRVGS